MLFIAEVEIRHCPPTPHCTSWAPLGSRGSTFRGGNRVLHSAGAPSRVVGSTCLDHRAGDVQMLPSRLQSTAHIYISKYHLCQWECSQRWEQEASRLSLQATMAEFTDWRDRGDPGGVAASCAEAPI